MESEMKKIYLIIFLDLFVAVEGWRCVSTPTPVYSRVNRNADLQFDISDDLSPGINFDVRFHNGTVLAIVLYKSNGEIATQKLSGFDITADAAGNVALAVINVEADNKGIYYISDGGRRRDRCNCLYILGTPTKPTVSVTNNPSVGGSATLTCSSTSTTTPSNHSLIFRYNWKVDNADNPSDSRYSYSSKRRTLTMWNLIKNDVNKQFTCTATEDVTDGYTSTRSDSVSLDIHYGPENVAFSPSATMYERGENTIINPVTCIANCNPPCSFKWKKDGQTAAKSNNAVLNLGTLTSSEAGVYRCTATRSGGSSAEKNLTVNVIYGPRNMIFSPDTTSYRYNENDDLPPITCNCDCFLCEYSWTGPNSYSYSGRVLNLDSLKRSMDGQYRCTATNTKVSPQKQISKEVTIEVTYGPDFVTVSPSQLNYTVDEGSTLDNIKCVATCFPPCTYRWTKHGQSGAVSNTDLLPLGTIQKHFTGKYTCTATNGEISRSLQIHIYINVRYGPYTKSTILTPSTQEYIRNENGNIVPDIRCSADCYPNCTYTWTKVRQGKTTTVSTSGLLSLGSLKRHDAANYTCTATNPWKSQSPETTKQVSVMVRYGPETSNINVHSPYYLTEGNRNIKIKCFSDCFPECSYVWTNLTSDLSIGTSDLLSIQLVSIYMTGDYKCTSTNAAVEYTKSSEKILTVIVKEKTSVNSFYIGEHYGQANVTVDEHDVDVRFTCVVGGDPASAVKITFEGEILAEQADTNELVFIRQEVDCLHSGLYTCEGSDNYGLASSKTTTLLVKCSPRPLRQMQRNITSLLNVPVKLTFKAIAYPEPGPKGFSWYKENKIGWTPLLSNEDLYVSSSGLQTSLTIRNVSRAQFGQYRVTVENIIGTYNQYLFLSEKGIAVVGTESCKDDYECTTLIIISSILGIICVVVIAYATGITILYKRKGIKHQDNKTSAQTTYVNSAYLSDATKAQERGQRREHVGDATGIDEDSLKQYTDLTQYSRDDRATYDVIQ